MGVVLVVDDEPTIRRLVASALALEGVATVDAPDAETAMELLDERVPDAIITDIQLPGMNGVEFAERIRRDERLSRVPVAFISAHDGAPSLPGWPPSKYFHKPFDVEDLLDWLTGVTLIRRDGGD